MAELFWISAGVFLCVAIVPVVYGARAAGAQRGSVRIAALALALQHALVEAAGAHIAPDGLGLAIGFVGTCLLYRWLFGMTFGKSLIVGMLGSAILWVVILLFAITAGLG